MFGNQYYNQQRYMPQGMQPQYVQPMPPVIPQTNTQIGIQGKTVDSIEVVKAMDIPLDGSISYFPLIDGTAIVTKQLQNDGTSKLVVFKPVDEQKNQDRYVTLEEVKNAINDIDLSELEDIKEDIKEIRKQVKELKSKKE